MVSKTLRYTFAVLAAVFVAQGDALSQVGAPQSASDCNAALVRDFEISDSSWQNRLTYISQHNRSDFETRVKDGNASALIKGIPITASFSEASEFVQHISNSIGIDFRQSGRNFHMFSGLGEAASVAYRACLEKIRTESFHAYVSQSAADGSSGIISIGYAVNTNADLPISPQTLTVQASNGATVDLGIFNSEKLRHGAWQQIAFTRDGKNDIRITLALENGIQRVVAFPYQPKIEVMVVPAENILPLEGNPLVQIGGYTGYWNDEQAKITRTAPPGYFIDTSRAFMSDIQHLSCSATAYPESHFAELVTQANFNSNKMRSIGVTQDDLPSMTRVTFGVRAGHLTKTYFCYGAIVARYSAPIYRLRVLVDGIAQPSARSMPFDAR
jgi:hypothetical protein